MSAIFEAQLEAFRAHSDVPLSDIEGYRQTIEDPSSLFLDPENAREHSPENLQAIGESLTTFGFRKNSICVQEGTRIVYAGNGIVTYLVYNDIDVCPVLWIPESFTEEEARAFALADNRSSDMSSWNLEQLEENLATVAENVDIEALGFDPEFMSQFDKDGAGDSVSRLTGDVTTVAFTFDLTPEEAEKLDIALRHADAESAEQKLLVIVDSYLDAVEIDDSDSA